MFDRLIQAFFPDRYVSPRARKLWAAAILLAPLAYLFGLALEPGSVFTGRGHMAVDREGALSIAHRFATAHGLKTGGWTELVRADPDYDVARYLNEHSGPGRDLVFRLAPSRGTVVTLISPERETRVQLRLDEDGRIAGYQLRGVLPAATSHPESVFTQEVAARWLKAKFRDPLPLPLSKPEISTVSREGDEVTHRVQWRSVIPEMPELQVVIGVDVRGGKVVGESASANLDQEYRDAHQPYRALKIALFWFFGLYVLALVIIVLIRYVQRTLQKEISHLRAAGIALFSGLSFFVYLLLSDQIMARSDAAPVPLWVGRLIALIIYMFLGGLLGLSYSASEGDLREIYPGKLTSLDAFLTGRLLSRNAATSVLAGIVIGGWMLLGHNLVVRAAGISSMWQAPEALNLFLFSRMPWFALLLTVPFGAIIESLTLLLPVATLHRFVRRKAVIFGLLIPLAFLSSLGFTLSQASQATTPMTATLLLCVVKTSGLLIAFFAFDLLACIASLSAFALTTFVLGYLHMSARLEGTSVIAVALLVVFTGVVTWFAFRGRALSDEEVRPSYARRMAERLSLQSEVAAAREAQLRLLPAVPPRIEGLSVAASCSAADDVGGDFYDFFRLSPTRLALLISDGGRRGLATALSIALAKGYLMQKAHAGLSPLDTLRSLRSTLGSVIAHDAASGLCYAVVDTGRGSVDYARTGISPAVLSETPFQENVVDGDIHVGSARLAEGARLVFYTDGVGARIGRRDRTGTDRWINQLLAWHRHAAAPELSDAILGEMFSSIRTFSPGKIEDDITLIVISVERTGARAREHVA